MGITSDWTVYAPIIIVILVAVLGFFATRRAVASDGWYHCINKAPFNPPNWVFGVAWTILYILIIIAWGRANYLVTDQVTFDQINWLFTINMILNLAWSFVFFGDGDVVVGLVIIILMIITAGALVYLLSFDPWAFSFLIVYTIWLLFAFALNWYVVRHNFILLPVKTCPLLN